MLCCVLCCLYTKIIHAPPQQGNVRGLLGSLQTVLWEDSGWKPINMGDLLEPAQVERDTLCGWVLLNEVWVGGWFVAGSVHAVRYSLIED